MKFHHIGIACDNIEEVLLFLEKTFTIMAKTDIIYDKNQDAKLCLVTTEDGTNIELVSGKTVTRFVKKRQFLYHNCWEVENMDKVIEKFCTNGSLLISESKPAKLFKNRKVAFLMSDIGIVELLESR